MSCSNAKCIRWNSKENTTKNSPCQIMTLSVILSLLITDFIDFTQKQRKKNFEKFQASFYLNTRYQRRCCFKALIVSVSVTSK